MCGGSGTGQASELGTGDRDLTQRAAGRELLEPVPQTRDVRSPPPAAPSSLPSSHPRRLLPTLHFLCYDRHLPRSPSFLRAGSRCRMPPTSPSSSRRLVGQPLLYAISIFASLGVFLVSTDLHSLRVRLNLMRLRSLDTTRGKPRQSKYGPAMPIFILSLALCRA